MTMPCTEPPPRRTGVRRGRAGYVLVFTLWILAGCSLLLATYSRSAVKPPVVEALATFPLRQASLENVSEFIARGFEKQNVTVDMRWQVQNEIARIEHASRNGMEAAAQQLMDMLGQMGFAIDLPDGTQAATLISEQRSKLANVPAGSVAGVALDAAFSSAGEAQTLTVAGHDYQIMASPLAARPNLNKLPAKALERYLITLGLPRDRAVALADALRHWRGDAEVPSAGWFESAYASDVNAYRARRGPITEWSELYLLAGASPDLVAFLRTHFSLVGVDARVPLQHATPETMAALADLDVSTVKAAVAHLKGPRPDISLTDVIGATEAARFEGVVATAGTPAEALVVVSDGLTALSFIYSPRTRSVEDAWGGR